MLVDPGHGLAIRRVDKAVPDSQSLVQAEHGALDLKAAAGAQFAREADIEPPRKTAGPQSLAEAERLGQVGLSLFESREIIGDREMLGDVAFPGRHRAAIGLDPIRHGWRPLGLTP